MSDPWQILRDGGLPLAMARGPGRPTERDLAAAVELAIAQEPTRREAEALAAFVSAWHHHWEVGFRQAFADPRSLLEWARGQIVDVDRYLKLRRIAIANLATVL
jgi:hypothetical protein